MKKKNDYNRADGKLVRLASDVWKAIYIIAKNECRSVPGQLEEILRGEN